MPGGVGRAGRRHQTPHAAGCNGDRTATSGRVLPMGGGLLRVPACVAGALGAAGGHPFGGNPVTGVFAAIARSMRLLEDAISLLRTGGLTALAMYLVGTLPLAMSLLATWGLFARTRASTSELA